VVAAYGSIRSVASSQALPLRFFSAHLYLFSTHFSRFVVKRVIPWHLQYVSQLDATHYRSEERLLARF
jgi:hypothetical protein